MQDNQLGVAWLGAPAGVTYFALPPFPSPLNVLRARHGPITGATRDAMSGKVARTLISVTDLSFLSLDRLAERGGVQIMHLRFRGMCWTPETRQTFRPRTMRACCLRPECVALDLELIGREKAPLRYHHLHLGEGIVELDFSFINEAVHSIYFIFEFALVREVKCKL